MAAYETFKVNGVIATDTADVDNLAKQHIGEFFIGLIVNSSTGAFTSVYFAGRSPFVTPTDITKTFTVS